MDNVAVGVSLDQTSGRSTQGAAHVSDEEAALGLGADLIGDGAQQGAVAVAELGVVGVADVPVEGSVLGLQQRQQATAHEGLAIERRAQVVRGVAAAGHVREVDNATECILLESASTITFKS